MRIAARKGDLTINDGKEIFTLQQGQETTRDESAQTVTRTARRRTRSAGWSHSRGGRRDSEFPDRGRSRRRRDHWGHGLGPGQERQSGQPQQTLFYDLPDFREP